MFNVLAGLVSPITGLVKNWQNRKQAESQAKHEVKMASLRNRQRLAASEQTHNSDKEMKMLEMARPWMRWVVAGHIMVLIDVTVLWPDKAREIYAALETMPKWTVGLFLTVFGFYFGVNKLTEQGAKLTSKWKGKAS